MNERIATHPLMLLWGRHSFRLHIAVLFTTLVFLIGIALTWSNYLQGRNIVLAAANDVFDRIEREVRGELLHARAPVEAVVDWMSRSRIVDAVTVKQRMGSLDALTEALNRYPALESIYVGYYNGDFFQVHALRNDADHKRFNAPRHAAYRLQSIERESGQVHFRLLDSALNEISSPIVPPEYSFDPRERPWYKDALVSTGPVQTAPYVFFTTQQVGQTVARRAEHGRAVVGADMTLNQLSELLALARPTPSSQLALFDAQGQLMAHSEPVRTHALDSSERPVLRKLAEVSPVLAAAMPEGPQASGANIIEAGDREWLFRVVPAAQTAKGTTSLALATPLDELLIAARAVLQRNLWLTLVLVILTAPLTWWTARRIAANLNILTNQAAAIRRFNFETPPPLDTRIIEVHELGNALRQMRETARKFVDITTALSSERKFDRLLQRVLQEARDAAGAQGSVIYLLDEDGQKLVPAEQRWNSNQAGDTRSQPALSLNDRANPVALSAGNSRPETHILPILRQPGLEYLDQHFGNVAVMLVTVPLLDRNGKVVGVLCLFLPESNQALSPERLALVQAFAGAGAIAIHNQQLLGAQKALLDALIKLIGSAIDAKSHYTAGHCQRVPELTYMLTEAACGQKTGPFADFNLSEEQWEALHIAGGLHDCGKVTTPEYVVDKATKLETLHNRIHEVRTRFEVLKRDAEIACLKAIAAGGDEGSLRTTLTAELRTLDEEFAFVATCNEGGEFMAPEKVERLKAIAARTWQRTLDDRLGLSWEEAARLAAHPAAPLPATEQLLADKPEHIIAREAEDILPENNPWGFKLAMPEAMYNRGELHNLSIVRGTLTDEERYKINDHIMQTIIMLSALPFSGHLKAVPELAGGHHEKMDGTGYPKRLARDDMSVPARIMAIADIFEALTAADRPYKKAKTLSEAIKIMSFMKKDRHVDPDLFDLFLRSGVYMDYARKFMQPEYIDEIDVQNYLGASASS